MSVGPIWFQLGHNIHSAKDLAEQIGKNFDVLESPVIYKEEEIEYQLSNKKILFRSDNKDSLGIVSSSFKPISPESVLKFFSDIAQKHGYEIDTAGSMADDTRFWAFASNDVRFKTAKGFEFELKLFFSSAIDGSMSTQIRPVLFYLEEGQATNSYFTLPSYSKRPLFKVTLKKEWDLDSIDINLSGMAKSLATIRKTLDELETKKIGPTQVRELFEDLLGFKSSTGWAVEREVMALTNAVISGKSSITYMDILLKASEFWNVGNSGRNISSRFWDSMSGSSDSSKQDLIRALSK